jgi:predicted transcriptional regulator
MGVLKLELPQQAQDGLARLATRAGIPAEAVASEALEHFVAEELAIMEGFERGLDDMRQGRLVSHEEVMRDIERLHAGLGSDRECVAAPKDAPGGRSRVPSLVDHLLSEPPWDDDLAEAVNRRGHIPRRRD